MPTNQIINDVLPWTQVTASASQTVFDTNWTSAYAENIIVYKRAAAATPDELTQILSTSAYTVTFVGTAQVVRVTLLSGATAGDIVTIIRDTPADRLNLYTNTNFVPSMLNQDTAILTLVDQERQMLNDLSVKYHVSGMNPNFAATQNLPVVPLTGNQVWATNPAGTAIIGYDVPEGGGLATKDAKYLLQQANAELPNAQSMGALSSGFVVNTATTGVQITRVMAPVANQTVVNNANGIDGNPSVGFADNAVIPGTAGMGIPAGTTAERVTPTPPSIGLRLNTTIGQLEAYIGAAWVLIPSSAAGLFLPLAGGTMTGNIEMDGNIIDGVPLPTTNNEAASKIYVDNAVGGAAGGLTGNMQYNNGGAFAGDAGINTDGLGNLEVDGSLRVDNVLINANRISPTAGLVELESAQLFNNLDADSNLINNLANPIVASDAANKAYVDAIASGFVFLNPVRGASTANYTVTYSNGVSGIGATLTATVNGAFTADGLTGVIGQRFLIKNQTSTLENGIYVVTTVGDGSNPFVLTRSPDFDASSEITVNELVSISEGTTQAGSIYRVSVNNPVIGTDPITFLVFFDAANIVTINGVQTITGAKTFDANVAIANASTFTLNATTAVNKILDEDSMVSNSATALATQQSIKAYVDSHFPASGTWPPTFSFSTPGTSVITHSTQIGAYVRIGNLMYVNFNIVFTVTSLGTAAGQMTISGLPAIVSASSPLNSWGSAACSPNITFPGARTQIGLSAVVGTNTIVPVSQGSGLGSIGFGITQLTAGVSTAIIGTVIYQV